jgi:hypothetical protein
MDFATLRHKNRLQSPFGGAQGDCSLDAQPKANLDSQAAVLACKSRLPAGALQLWRAMLYWGHWHLFTLPRKVG